jgi:23S rRNA (uracil1939-C5)-methyltransferase
MKICRHKDQCGGCSYQGVPYDEQLRNKEGEVRRLMADRGVDVGTFAPIEPAPQQYRYRNKMEYTFGDMVKDGPLTLGMHQKKRFMSVVTVDECQLVHEDFNRVLRAVLDHCRERGCTKYHKKKHRGLLRNLIVRIGQNTGEMLINIVTTGEDGFDEAAFCAMLQALQPRLEHRLVGVLRTFNDDLADAVKADRVKILWGRDYYMERILGLDFKVSAFSFFQTNVPAVERLYSEALDLLDDYTGKNVYDLFCGTGTITQVLARRARHVYGIELVEEAVAAARDNARRNGLDNCTFLAGDVFQVLDRCAKASGGSGAAGNGDKFCGGGATEEKDKLRGSGTTGNITGLGENGSAGGIAGLGESGAAGGHDDLCGNEGSGTCGEGGAAEQEGADGLLPPPDVIVVDPPRAGISGKALDRIIAYQVPQIIYISCNPKTLAENLFYFQFYGYRVDYLKPFDNFAMSRHVETIVLMTRT